MNVYHRYAEPTIRSKDRGLAVLRAVLGFVFFMHGWQKVFDLGIPMVAGFFAEMGAPLPAVTGPLVAVLELVGGAALVLGLGTPVVALLLAIDMLGAILIYHLGHGFFAPDGVELTLLLLAGTVTLVLAGPGALALDGVIARPRARR